MIAAIVTILVVIWLAGAALLTVMFAGADTDDTAETIELLLAVLFWPIAMACGRIGIQIDIAGGER
ncbi:hypothetical protein D1610_11665 [Sphingomonas gilva]|uniref:Uncharacterized protein n=1 Tax=Sphingomonas gilva TaxID=2305907 RepID=A0A396RLK0_9SPHN|nr:hypothetical protein [Sphingomonas gilva]RHW17200.1 hypothetical protein D1610_11665 [Sphingomonas gilva]